MDEYTRKEIQRQQRDSIVDPQADLKKQQDFMDMPKKQHDFMDQGKQQAMGDSIVDPLAETTKGLSIDEVATSIRRKCAFCGSEGFLGRAGICSSCSEKLMKDLLKTHEWKNAIKVISEGIDKRISNHESKKHR